MIISNTLVNFRWVRLLKKNVTFFLDTGSTESWIPSYKPCYSPKNSSTANITKTPCAIYFGLAKINGFMGTDNISLP